MQRPRSFSRRTVLAQALRTGPAVLAWTLLFPKLAQAGRQLEEPLVDSVRSALSSAIHQSAPPVPAFAQEGARQHYERWLDSMAERLHRRKADALEHKEFLPTVWYESKRAGLDVALVLGLIFGLAVVAKKVSGKGGGLMGAMGPGGKAPAGLLEVLGRYPLARGQTLWTSPAS